MYNNTLILLGVVGNEGGQRFALPKRGVVVEKSASLGGRSGWVRGVQEGGIVLRLQKSFFHRVTNVPPCRGRGAGASGGGMRWWQPSALASPVERREGRDPGTGGRHGLLALGKTKSHCDLPRTHRIALQRCSVLGESAVLFVRGVFPRRSFHAVGVQGHGGFEALAWVWVVGTLATPPSQKPHGRLRLPSKSFTALVRAASSAKRHASMTPRSSRNSSSRSDLLLLNPTSRSCAVTRNSE